MHQNQMCNAPPSTDKARFWHKTLQLQHLRNVSCIFHSAETAHYRTLPASDRA